MHRRPILVIENDEADIEQLRQAFGQSCAVNPLVFKHSGQEALDYLKSKDGTESVAYKTKLPCLVILDLKLPDMAGTEVLKKIRQNLATRRIPIIVLSRSEEEADVISAYQSGANSFIRKNCPAQQFNENIQCLCLYWLNIAQLPA